MLRNLTTKQERKKYITFYADLRISSNTHTTSILKNPNMLEKKAFNYVHTIFFKRKCTQ